MIFRKVFVIGWLMIFVLSCAKPKPDEKALAMWGAYNALLTKYQNLLKSAENDSLYRALLENKKSDLNLLLQQYRSESTTAELELVRSQVLIELKEYERAGQLLDQLVAQESRYSIYARFQKVRLLQSTRKYSAALELFWPIEKKMAEDEQYLDVLFNFAFEAPDRKDREYFSRKLFNLNKWPENDLRYKSDIIENLALLEKMKGNAEEARKILNEGIAELTGTGSEISLQATLNLMDLVGKTAPGLTAETWFNSPAFELSDQKGKVVVIDFWAPWCAPCRVVIPTLVEIYQQNKDKGLVLLGYTRLYGYYRDEKQRFDKIEAKEEISLIREFLKRFNMSYPVAIARGKEGFESYHIHGIPTLIIIDRQGQVADFKIGSGNEQYVKDRIQQLLNAD
jgi:thiol-disulfide isomerase/thioredoxin